MTVPILDRVPPLDLAARVYGAARRLAAGGAAEGSRIAVDPAGTAGPADVLAWLLGADLIGAATLVLEPAWADRERAAVLADARPDTVVTGTPEQDVSPVVASGDGATPFYLATTSGSGGRPKVVVRSRDSWLRSFVALGPLPGPVLVAGPLSSSLFLFGALHGLWCGARVRLLPRFDPVAATRAATVHLVPAMLGALLDAVSGDPDGCALRTVVCGGALLPDELCDRFERLLPDAELVEYYGSAEHSLIAIRRAGTGLRPVPGVDLDLRDGLLWVRSPLACRGYLRGGRLDPAGSWSTVGDRVDRRPDGTLVVHGRAGAMVSSGGRLVAAEEVEAALRGVAGVAEVLVTGTPHARLGALVTAVVEAVPGHRPALRDLRAAARTRLAPGKRPRRWLLATALPRTASGKPARAATADLLRDGTLATEPWR